MRESAVGQASVRDVIRIFSSGFPFSRSVCVRVLFCPPACAMLMMIRVDQNAATYKRGA